MADKSWDDQYISKTDAIKLAIISVVPHTNPFNIHDFQRSFENTIGDFTPSEDVAEVVRCKDCKYWMRERISCEGLARCATGESGIRYRCENDFCSRGARMDGGT